MAAAVIRSLGLLGALAGFAGAREVSLHALQAFDQPGAVVDWYSVDDRVMGGVSRSALVKSADGASFVGDLSLNQGGGFASVRSSDQDTNLAGHLALVVRARGDGKRYKLSVRTAGNDDGVVYQHAFVTPPGEWAEVILPLADFRATWRGRTVPDAAPLSGAKLVSLGLLISDRQSGPFRLDVAWIALAGDPAVSNVF